MLPFLTVDIWMDIGKKMIYFMKKYPRQKIYYSLHFTTSVTAILYQMGQSDNLDL